MTAHADRGDGYCAADGAAYPCPHSSEADEMVGAALRPKSVRKAIGRWKQGNSDNKYGKGE